MRVTEEMVQTAASVWLDTSSIRAALEAVALLIEQAVRAKCLSASYETAKAQAARIRELEAQVNTQHEALAECRSMTEAAVRAEWAAERQRFEELVGRVAGLESELAMERGSLLVNGKPTTSEMLVGRVAELEAQVTATKAQLDVARSVAGAAEADLAQARAGGGNWTEADRNLATAAVRAITRGCDVNEYDVADAALDAVVHRLDPSAHEVTLDDAREVLVICDSVDLGSREDEMFHALRTVFAARPTASEAQEPAHEVYCSACDCQHKASACSQDPAQPVRCDYGDKCPGHTNPDDRPCGYEEPAQPAADDLSAYERRWQVSEPAQPTSGSWRADAEALLEMGAQHIDARTVRGVLDEQPAVPAGWQHASPADALRPDDRHGLVEQPAEVADVLTEMERALVNEVPWMHEGNEVAQSLVALVNRLASELAKERERVARTEARVKETMQAAGEAENELAQLRERVGEVAAKIRRSVVNANAFWADKLDAALQGAE
jgi:hypothetical protein